MTLLESLLVLFRRKGQLCDSVVLIWSQKYLWFGDLQSGCYHWQDMRGNVEIGCRLDLPLRISSSQEWRQPGHFFKYRVQCRLVGLFVFISICKVCFISLHVR